MSGKMLGGQFNDCLQFLLGTDAIFQTSVCPRQQEMSLGGIGLLLDPLFQTVLRIGILFLRKLGQTHHFEHSRCVHLRFAQCKQERRHLRRNALAQIIAGQQHRWQDRLWVGRYRLLEMFQHRLLLILQCIEGSQFHQGQDVILVVLQHILVISARFLVRPFLDGQ
jgi:hypothetical protein